ncbi:DUF4097 family beta strand repeat-containing protein [Streptomyces sp. E11-3]|uniref:DUF4097 family beta strand repeat-containing protein n=1 Tax=Streptomyces sp. E11-3 TaxID=3110112 RepID=UPI00397FDAE1
MASFDTPEPISVAVEIAMGDIRLIASDRTDTVVEVRPTDSSKASDVKAAEQLRVGLSRGTLTVRTPTRLLRRSDVERDGGSVDVTIELPEGSRLRGGSVWAALRSEGRLGECRFETVESDIRLDRTGPLRLTVVCGDITVARASGHAEITNRSGRVRIGEIDGSAVIKNDHGDNTVGEVTGTLRVTGINGDIDIDRAYGGVEAKTAHGSIRVGEVRRGLVLLTAASGEVEVGIREGTAAKYDVTTVSGAVHNSLESVDGPGSCTDIVEVRVRTFDGNVAIRRSQ